MHGLQPLSATFDLSKSSKTVCVCEREGGRERDGGGEKGEGERERENTGGKLRGGSNVMSLCSPISSHQITLGVVSNGRIYIREDLSYVG